MGAVGCDQRRGMGVQNIQRQETEKLCFRPASELVRVKHLHSKRFILGSNEQLVNWGQIKCLDLCPLDREEPWRSCRIGHHGN